MDIPLVRNPVSTEIAKNKIIHTGNATTNTFPTMAEINSDFSDWNQAAALCNRRSQQVGVGDVVSYLPDGYIPYSWLLDIRTKINNWRTAISGPYTFTSGTPFSGSPVKAAHLNELFGAMAVTSPTASYGITNNRRVKWNDNPYGTFEGGRSYSSFGGGFGTNQWIGKLNQSNGLNPDRLERIRVGFSFGISSGISASVPPSTIVTLHIGFGDYDTSIENFDPAVYASASDDNSYVNGWEYNTNTHVGTGNRAIGGYIDQEIDITFVLGNWFGSHLSLIVGEDKELIGAGGSGFNTHDAAVFYASASPSITVDYNYGF